MIIVFGGSFNPPTKAHVHIIKHLLSLFEASKVIVVPVGDDYRKPELIAFEKRLEMLKIALDHMPNVFISSIESNRGYQGTLRTLDDLSKEYEDIHFVIGSDNLRELDTWINYKELLARYPFIVMNRKGYMTEDDANELYKDLPHRFIFVDFNNISASSTIRKNVRKNSHLLDPKVYQYIIDQKLYEEKKDV